MLGSNSQTEQKEFNTSPQSQKHKWNELSPPETTDIRQKLMNIGESIWFCTDYDKGEKGIVQYHISNNTYMITPYPEDLGKIKFHSCCHDKHLIYIVNGCYGKYGNLIIFNSKTKQFIRTISLPKIGGCSTSIMINQQLHIFNGSENDGDHIIYDPTTKELKANKDHVGAKKIAHQHIIIDNNQIIRFGGYSYNTSKYLDDFVIGDINTNNNNDNYKWVKHKQYTVPIPLRSAGYVKWRQYLIIMGGSTTDHKDTDDIYILNVNNSSSKNKWIKSNIKCPIKSWYRAILMENEMVHIIKCGYDNPGHFSIHVSEILDDLYKSDEDEKEDDEIEYHTMKHPLIILLCISRYDGNNSLEAVPTDQKLMKSLWLDVFKYDKKYVSIVTEEIGNEYMKESDINKYLNDISSKLQLNHYPKADGLIFIYSGHGASDRQNRNGIISSDLKLILTRKIQEKFNAENCDFLSKKPKLFYMDCCRGDQDMDAKEVEQVKSPKNKNNVGQRYVSPLSDFYTHMSTSQDYGSWTKSKKEGSHMINALYTCLKQAHEKKKMDKWTVHNYSTKINQMVNESYKGLQTPEISHKLTYDVYINPQKKKGLF